ncbi:putative protein [Arabidopsis thaliana]|nr:putative protein [Arabidopsis thaliana]
MTSCQPKRRRVEHLRCSAQPSSIREDDEDADDRRDTEMALQKGGQLRYFLDDDDSPLQGILEERETKPDNNSQSSNSSETNILWLPDVDSQNVKLAEAVGVGSFSGTSAAATAAASAAAIRWVSKDGIGALGRLLIGGRFGSLFDDDPKQWRMYADFIGSAGSFFDLATQLYPSQFLLLASTGNLAKAVARGLRDPSFRVIQNHFAISGNLGEVAAKEEVWEVAAQLIGLGFGILIIDTPGLVKSFPFVLLTWTSIRLVHLWLRYQSLAVLQFNTVNLKRARIIVESHVVHSVVPGYVDCNKRENILLWQRFMKPRIIFGVSLEELSGLEKSVSKVKALLKMYTKEKYILTLNKLNKDTEFSVSFKVNATSRDVLRCLWQAYWLEENMEESFKDKDSVFHWLKQSLSEMDNKFDDFLFKLDTAGWNLRESNLKVPNQVLIDQESIPF